MKKYEAPIVELTKFDVEDVITTSGGGSTPTPIDVTTLTDAGARADAAADIAGNTANGLDGVFSW